MRITHKNIPFEVENIKFCKLQNSTRIYLFRVLKQPVLDGKYIVAAKLDEDTLTFKHFLELKTAIQYYLDTICQYA